MLRPASNRGPRVVDLGANYSFGARAAGSSVLEHDNPQLRTIQAAMLGTLVLMKKNTQGPTSQLTGRWRIIEMDEWDSDAIDLLKLGFIEFTGDRHGEFGFIVVRGWMDCRPYERDGQPGVEFSWNGDDDGRETSGRGWAVLVDDETVEGHIFFHLGMDSAFVAKPFGNVH